MGIKFSEYRPSLPLSQLVQTYWTGEFNLYSENNFTQSVIPNGSVELIIHLTEDHCELYKENNWGKSPEFTLIGLQTKTYEVKFNQPVTVFGIRFNPEAIHTIFGLPSSHFISSFENSKDIFGGNFDNYCSKLRESGTINEKITLTDNFLLKELSSHSGHYDYVTLASEIIRRNHGIITQENLMKQIPVSPRQLQREFKNKMGITAKEYMRISRFNAIQKYIMGTGHVNLTRLSYEKGFADQSHFTREFKLLTGTNPKKFLKDKENFIINPACQEE